MTIFYFAAWAASVLYGVETVFEKIASKHSVKNPWLFNFVFQSATLIFTIIVALRFGAGFPRHWEFIILASLFYALGGIFYILSLYKLDVSVLSPLFSLRTAMTVILGALFLGEILSVHQYILIAIIFVAGIFVSVDERFHIKSFFNRAIFIALLDMLCLALWSVFIKKAVAIDDFWTVTLWIAVIGQVWFMFTIPLFIKDARTTAKKQYGSIALIALIGTMATLAANYAFSRSISLASAIISIPVSLIIAFLCSYFAPELMEKHTTKVYLIRGIAAAVMIFAALYL